MKICIVINKSNFEKWKMSYPSFELFLGTLRSKFELTHMYIDFDCTDELYKQIFEKYLINDLDVNSYDFILNYYNSIILSEYDFINTNLNNSINYIVSKKFISHPGFYYNNPKINKQYAPLTNILVDYIWTNKIN